MSTPPDGPERGDCAICKQSVRGVRIEGRWYPVVSTEHDGTCPYHESGLGRTREGYAVLETGVLRTAPPDHEVSVWYEIVEVSAGDVRVDMHIQPSSVRAPRHLSLKGWLRILRSITSSLKQHTDKASARARRVKGG